MTRQQENHSVKTQGAPQQTSELSSRMARLLGAFKALKATSSQKTPADSDAAQTNTDEQPPVEWVMQLMM